MRKMLFGAASAAALLAGTAFAQAQATDQPMQPADQAPAATSPASPAGDTAATDDMTTPGDTAATQAAPMSSGSGTEVSADDMIGRTVYGDGDQEIGEVTDVIVDPDSKQVNRLVIGTGGFLGIGKKTVAIDMSQVQIRPEQGIYVSGLTREDVEGMEEYDPDDATASLDEPAPTTTGTGVPAGGMASPSTPPPAATGQ